MSRSRSRQRCFLVALAVAPALFAACGAAPVTPPAPPASSATGAVLASASAPPAAAVADPAPVSSVFPVLAASARAVRVAHVEEILAGGVQMTSDAVANPRRVTVRVGPNEGQQREISGSNVDSCRFRLLPSPKGDPRVSIVSDGRVVTSAKVVGAPPAAQAFATCAEAALVGSRLDLPAGTHGGGMVFQAAAP